MTIQNIKEAEEALLPYVPLVAQVEANTTLDRIKPLMELLGNPQNKLNVVHIAGTSGKTSTAYYMSALLTASGKKVGLTISPHVDSITERVQINGRPVSEAKFCSDLAEFLELVESATQKPSYFELMYAFAIWVFEREAVDYAVIETGMGGLHDATNVVTRENKVCVITDIGLDHTHILGDTIEKIARQKIGIVHPGNTVFTYWQSDEVMAVFSKWIEDKRASLHVVEVEPASSNMPEYQHRNWSLAHAVYEYLEGKDNLPHLTSQVLLETQRIQVPARMDIRQIDGKTIIMDGAHNAQKMATFVTSFQKLYPNAKTAILIALKADKENSFEALAPILKPIANRVIVTTFETSQDLPVKSAEPELLADVFQKASMATEIIADQKAAFQALMRAPEKVCVITGSFFLISQVRLNEKLATNPT